MINPVINLYPYAHPQVYTLYNNILFIVYELLYNYHVKISSYISKTTTNKQITFLCNNNNLLNCVLIGRKVIHSVDSLSLILFFLFIQRHQHQHQHHHRNTHFTSPYGLWSTFTFLSIFFLFEISHELITKQNNPKP